MYPGFFSLTVFFHRHVTSVIKKGNPFSYVVDQINLFIDMVYQTKVTLSLDDSDPLYTQWIQQDMTVQ